MGYFSAAVALGLSAILFIVALPPFNHGWTLLFFMIPTAWAWLTCPRATSHLSLIPWLMFFIFFRIYQSSITVFLIWLTIGLLIQLILIILAKLSRDRFRYLPIWIIPPLLVLADGIRFRIWGTLFSFASLLADYPWLIRSVDIFGPLFPVLFCVFTQFWLMDWILYPNHGKIISGSALALFWLFLLGYGIVSSSTLPIKTNNLMVTFTILERPIPTEKRFLERMDQYLRKINRDPQNPLILLLPFLPFSISSENEAISINPWGNLARNRQIDIIYGCRDTLLNNAVCPYINSSGHLVEIGEQQRFYRLNSQNYQPGDYTLGIDNQHGKIGVLCNEEIFFEYPGKTLNRSGYGMIYNPMENSQHYPLEYIRKALVVSALMNREAILSNISNGGQIGIDPDGRCVHFMQLFKRILFYQVTLQAGKAFSRYQRWGDIIFYGAFLMIGMPLLIRFLVITQNKMNLKTK